MYTTRCLSRAVVPARLPAVQGPLLPPRCVESHYRGPRRRDASLKVSCRGGRSVDVSGILVHPGRGCARSIPETRVCPRSGCVGVCFRSWFARPSGTLWSRGCARASPGLLFTLIPVVVMARPCQTAPGLREQPQGVSLMRRLEEASWACPSWLGCRNPPAKPVIHQTRD
jgi:hypothetical protein